MSQHNLQIEQFAQTILIHGTQYYVNYNVVVFLNYLETRLEIFTEIVLKYS